MPRERSNTLYLPFASTRGFNWLISRLGLVLEGARLAGERKNRTPRPLVRWADAHDDLVGEPVLVVGAVSALRRDELPEVARHPMDGEWHQ